MSIRLEPATRHYDEKLQQILKTSAKIFAEKGFHHTSVRDISRATKMSLSGLYYYFATKEELLYLIQERCFVTLLQRWEQAVGLDLDARARIRSFASIGSEPAIMLTGPAPASEKALKRAGMSVKDIDLWELNEAFAAVVLRYLQILKMPHDKINVNGGAIAMGHPLGATGAMILGTLLDELERRNLSTGLATLCVGGGMGTATIIERI